MAMMSAQELTLALGGHWRGSYGSAKCPAHPDRNPSLTVREGDTGRPLIFCQSGCEQAAVLAALRSRGLWAGPDDGWQPDPEEIAGRRAKAEADRQRKVDHARDLWAKSVPIVGTPAERYLRARGIVGEIPGTLRYSSGIKHGPTGLMLPALLAAVTHWPSREVAGIHRIFILADGRGKAPVSDQKMMLGHCAGGAVRLAPPGPKLALAEGIETGLSVMQMTGTPTWACLSTSGLKSLKLPPEAREIEIFADHDASGAGESAAKEAMERFVALGRKVEIIMPKQIGDFNDVLRGRAA